MSLYTKPFYRFMLLWTGDFISSVGSGLTSFGLGVYIFQETGKTFYMALITLLGFLPSLLLSVPAGVLADRCDRRLLMIIGDGFSAAGPAFILLCFLNGPVHMWQLCIGVAVSSVFTSLLEPSYKATITDLLTPEQYSKASGLVSAAGSAKYLISPILAGFLLTISDIRLLLVLDICTFFVTVTTTMAVRRGLATKVERIATDFREDIKEGVRAIGEKKGIVTLVSMGTVITLCLGFIQTLAAPMVLSFTDSAALGTLMTIIAMGMLVSGILLGALTVRKGYVRLLCASLFWAGVFMAAFGLRENILLIGISGFLFFATLPFANASLDYLIRINIDNGLQGRAWGVIGLVSQMGYVVAYAASGLLADCIFTPLLLPGGGLAQSAGRIFGTGAGRGIGLLIALAGLMLCVAAAILYHMKSIKELEKGGCYEK